MRRALFTLIAVAVGVFGLAAPARAGIPTELSISGPTSVATGESATITGRLFAGRAGVPDRPVALFQAPSPSGPWTHSGTAITTSLGFLSLTVPNLTATTHFRWFYAAAEREGDYDPSSSPVHMVTVQSGPHVIPPTLTIAGPNSIPSGEFAQISTVLTHEPSPGQVTALAGRTVTLSSSPDGVTWTTLINIATDPNGEASHTDTGLTATRHYRWSFAGDAQHLPATSPVHVVTVVSDPDPPVTGHTALSIHTQPAWIKPGESSVIEGVLWRGGTRVAGQDITLHQTLDAGQSWTLVDRGTTNAVGMVKISVAPTRHTLYQWRFAGTRGLLPSTSPSAGVTLNDQVPATLTIQLDQQKIFRGEPVTVSGILATAQGPRPGRPVRLERSVDGGAFVEVVSVFTGPTGRAQWTDTPPKTAVYRWVFDGSPSVGPAVSASAQVTVSPALRGKLTIAAPERITIGQTAVIQAAFSVGDQRVPGATIELYAKPPGSGFVLHTTAVTDAKGRVKVAVQPSVHTTYAWRYPGSFAIRQTTSSQRVVRVAAAVQAKARTRKVKVGGKIVVTGSVHPGATHPLVRVFRVGSGTQAALAKGKTDGYGEFTLKFSALKAGTYRLFVRSEKTSFRNAGESKVFVVTVK